MSWSIEGSYFETCSCELLCPFGSGSVIFGVL